MRPVVLILVACVGLACQEAPTEAAAARAQARIATCFEPDDDCIALAVREIGAAEREILIQAYAFTGRRISGALREAEARGVQVRMIVDVSRENSERIRSVSEGGAEVLTDDGVSLQHNKIMIFDRRRVLTGSQNFTAGSNTHAENMLIIEDERTVNAYLANWLKRAAMSRPYVFRSGSQSPENDGE